MSSSTLPVAGAAAACALLLVLSLTWARSAVRAGHRAAAQRATLLAATVLVPLPALGLIAMLATLFGRGPIIQLMVITTVPLAVSAIAPITQALRRRMARMEGTRLTPTPYAAVDVGVPPQYWIVEIIVVFLVVASVGVVASRAFGPSLVLVCGLPIAVALPTVLRASLAPRFAGPRLAKRVSELQAAGSTPASGAGSIQHNAGDSRLIEARAWAASLTAAHGLPAPAVIVARMSATYVASSSPTNTVIVIDEALFDAFTPPERRAVLAHEVAHLVRHERMRRALAESLLAAWYVGVFLLFTHLRGPVGWAYLVGWMVSLAVVRRAVQRRSIRQGEFAADRMAVRWLGDAGPMIAALQTMARVRKVPLERRHGLRPSFGERITALRKLDMAGRGHLP